MRSMKGVPLNDELYNYILDKFVPEEQLLNDLVKETEDEGIPLIQVAPEQGKVLYLLCKIANAKDALEIGTLTGFSGIHIARGITGRLTTVDINPKNSALAEKYFRKAGLKDRGEFIVADAVEYMERLVEQKRKFDVIFIDADKISYPVYFKKAMELSHSNTIIIFDNTLRGGRIAETATDHADDIEIRATQELNNLMANDSRLESLLIPIGDGFTLGRVI